MTGPILTRGGRSGNLPPHGTCYSALASLPASPRTRTAPGRRVTGSGRASHWRPAAGRCAASCLRCMSPCSAGLPPMRPAQYASVGIVLYISLPISIRSASGESLPFVPESEQLLCVIRRLDSPHPPGSGTTAPKTTHRHKTPGSQDGKVNRNPTPPVSSIFVIIWLLRTR